jgi:RNA polymerase sigma-70 factor (ECF subfamily)
VSPRPALPTQHEALVARAVAGDGDALSALLSTFGPRVEQGLKIGRRWRTAIDPADVMQITYLEAFLQIARFRPEQADSFEAWLSRMAQNNLRDAIRGLERQKQPPPSRRIQPSGSREDSFADLYDRLAAVSSTPSRALARKDVRRLIEAALEKLPPDYARAVRLYDLEGRPIAEVAAGIQRSAGAVHMIRARAHERLAELLGTLAHSLGA